jgi:hypothetical protein
LNDLNDQLGIFFIFPDLCIRAEGAFRFRFSLIDLSILMLNEGEDNFSRVESFIVSDPFHVYSPKRFPGMLESTELSLCFSKQGVKIPGRKHVEDGQHGSYSPI